MEGVLSLPGGFRVCGSSLTSWCLQGNGSVKWPGSKLLVKQKQDYFSAGSVPWYGSLCCSTNSTANKGVVWGEMGLYGAARKQETFQTVLLLKPVFHGTQFVVRQLLRSGILAAKIPSFFFWWGAEIGGSHKGHGWHMHAPVLLESLELALWTAIEGIAQVCLNR